MKLSIIVPALNESEHITATINSIIEKAVLGDPYEIIVVDPGSVDDTADIASGLGAKVISSGALGSGRAYALNHGAGYASGNVYLFLDADTTLPNGYDQSISEALSDSATVGGAFEFTLDGPGIGLRLVELLNRTRYRIRQRYYGDQGIFVRADIFKKVDGYPPVRLLEAAHFCSSMKQEGKLTLIKKPIITSPRRFITGGIYSVLANDIKIWFLDLVGLPVDQYADDYWADNKTGNNST